MEMQGRVVNLIGIDRWVMKRWVDMLVQGRIQPQLELRLQPPLGSEARAQLETVLERLRQAARDAGRQGGRSLWRRFFLVRDAFASLGPAAVLTVHRSQGSTFAEVFVDADVFWPRDVVLRRQLVYMAVSRASQSVSLMASDPVQGSDPGAGALWRDWLEESANSPDCAAGD